MQRERKHKHEATAAPAALTADSPEIRSKYSGAWPPAPEPSDGEQPLTIAAAFSRLKYQLYRLKSECADATGRAIGANMEEMIAGFEKALCPPAPPNQ